MAADPAQLRPGDGDVGRLDHRQAWRARRVPPPPRRPLWRTSELGASQPATGGNGWLWHLEAPAATSLPLKPQAESARDFGYSPGRRRDRNPEDTESTEPWLAQKRPRNEPTARPFRGRWSVIGSQHRLAPPRRVRSRPWLDFSWPEAPLPTPGRPWQPRPTIDFGSVREGRSRWSVARYQPPGRKSPFESVDPVAGQVDRPRELAGASLMKAAAGYGHVHPGPFGDPCVGRGILLHNHAGVELPAPGEPNHT